MTTSTLNRSRTRAYLRLRPQLVERLKTEARQQHLSFNSYVESLLLDTVREASDAEMVEAVEERQETLCKARALTAEDIREIEQKDSCTPQELRLLLYRVVDDVYKRA